MSAALAPRDPGAAPAAVLSILVHALLFAFLFFGVHWVSKTPDAVVVELWDRPPSVEPPAVQPAPKVEPKPAPKPEPKPEPKVEPKPSKPDIALEKEKKVPEKKVPPKKEEPKLKLRNDKDMRDEAAREMERIMRDPKLRAAAPKAAPLPAGPVADAGYADKIKLKIKSNIVLPPDIAGNPEAIFEVLQLPTGEVLSAKLKKSSGHRGYDAAVERAILKSSPLPRPDRPDQFRRELQLKFRPQE
ncbi:MAG: TonB C-terminal domain-containing protein [Betaproteobacteria bacterium]|nr:TonB C-terminal domain-containing protein [Betaproteobacteria bacterium]